MVEGPHPQVQVNLWMFHGSIWHFISLDNWISVGLNYSTAHNKR